MPHYRYPHHRTMGEAVFCCGALERDWHKAEHTEAPAILSAFGGKADMSWRLPEIAIY
jgi:hypothetical protein